MMKCILAILMIVIVSGCTTNNSKKDIVNSIIKQRLAEIEPQLPVENGPYALTKSSPSGSDGLELVITGTRITSSTENYRFLNDYGISLCNDSSAKNLISIGGHYLLVLRQAEVSQRNLMVDNLFCNEN